MSACCFSVSESSAIILAEAERRRRVITSIGSISLYNLRPVPDGASDLSVLRPLLDTHVGDSADSCEYCYNDDDDEELDYRKAAYAFSHILKLIIAHYPPQAERATVPIGSRPVRHRMSMKKGTSLSRCLSITEKLVLFRLLFFVSLGCGLVATVI